MSSESPLNICLTFDFDGMCVWDEVFKLNSPTPLSRGEFCGRVAAPRILDLLAREEIKATFFTPGHTIDTFPEVCQRILAEGHEIGHHGYYHEGPVTLAEAEERAVLERGLEAMERNLDGYRPQGYRSPAFDLSANSTGLLLEYGMKYDSSMMAQDFEPYWARTGDEISRDLDGYRFGPEIELVELPVSWSLDDFIQLEYVVSPVLSLPGANTIALLRDQWIADLDFAAEEVPGGVFNMTFHPQVIGRGARLRIVEAMIARGREHGANFVTCAEAASAWAATAPAPSGVPA